MPWGWAPRHEARAQSHAEPSSTAPWKEHEALVLKRLLASNKGRFNLAGLTDEKQAAYLQKQIQAGVREEAEADLVHGFRAWLQGTHDENRKNRNEKYRNEPDGRPHRRKMDGTCYDDVRTDWQSTPWGDAQLTHLPGVREWLRENAIATDKADLEMQILAEYGPHDLESAWQYYKHWVLKRPISYPHAHADQHGPRWDKENWHGPGLHSAANEDGWSPRRSTHFDALPEPPSKRPPGGGGGTLSSPSLLAGVLARNARRYSTARPPSPGSTGYATAVRLPSPEPVTPPPAPLGSATASPGTSGAVFPGRQPSPPSSATPTWQDPWSPDPQAYVPLDWWDPFSPEKPLSERRTAVRLTPGAERRQSDVSERRTAVQLAPVI